MSDTSPPSPSEQLFVGLWRELHQTEESAKDHPRVEAERVGPTTPPGRAMLAVVAHAERVLQELPALAAERSLPDSTGGKAVGRLFSVLRDGAADLVLTLEQSYRGTLLGMRHGHDVVSFVRRAASARGDTKLVQWCDRWHDERNPLVREVEEQLSWFAQNPERALEPAKGGPLASAARAVLAATNKVEGLLGGGQGSDRA